MACINSKSRKHKNTTCLLLCCNCFHKYILIQKRVIKQVFSIIIYFTIHYVSTYLFSILLTQGQSRVLFIREILQSSTNSRKKIDL